MSWLRKIESLKVGEACEFRYPARTEWLPGVVVTNGGAHFWQIRDMSDTEGRRGKIAATVYIEHVRLPGQIDAWPQLERRADRES